MIHTLKLNDKYWRPVMLGHKTTEIRNNDRGFEVGHGVVFKRVKRGWFTGPKETGENSQVYMITHIVHYEEFKNGLKHGHCMFSFEPLIQKTDQD